MTNACPSLDDLQNYRSNWLPVAHAEAVRLHLSTCEACRLTFERIPVAEARARAAHPAAPFATPEESQATLATDSAPSARMARHFPRIEGYQITGVLGQGGMGIVYRAVQTRLNRAVALKVLPAIVGSASPSAVSRFRREATAAARLHHTHIVPIYDFGESRDAYYYAMELITGQPLNVLIKHFGDLDAAGATPARLARILNTPPGQFTPSMDGEWPESPSTAGTSAATATSTSGRGRPYFRQVARWMADAADALHYAHGQNIFHRDIKPANLMLSADGRIMIADFGLAKSSEEESVTLTGSLLGTVRYLSPEQAMAKRIPVDHRTDIYSLGATMYELLCFQPAFPGTDDKQVLAAIITRDATPPRKFVHAVPHEMEVICLKCLEKSPDARYATARALADDLERFIHDLPIVAKPPGMPTRIVKYIRRHKAPAIGTVALVLLAVAAAVIHMERKARLVADRDRLTLQVQSLCDAGRSLADHAQWEAAEARFREALSIDPHHAKAMLTLVWTMTQHLKTAPLAATPEKLEELAGMCRRVLELTDGDPTALQYLTWVYKRMGRYDDAIATAKRILDRDAGEFAAWSNLGTLYALTGDLESAEPHLLKGAELADAAAGARPVDRVAAWRNLAALQIHLGRSDAPLQLKKAAEAKPDDIIVWVLRARERLGAAGGDATEALDFAKVAEAVAHGESAWAKRVCALAELRKGNYPSTLEYVRAALRLGDMPAINHLIAAIAEAKRGNSIGARDRLRAAADEWPAALKSKPFVATLDEGILWFESVAELNELKETAERALAEGPPAPAAEAVGPGRP